MIIASAFSLSPLTVLIVIACQQTVVSAFDSITRLTSDTGDPYPTNRSRDVDRVPFQGFGHIVTIDEDDVSEEKKEGDDDSDSSVDDENDHFDSNFTSITQGNQLSDFKIDSLRPDGCSCSPEFFTCECFGDSVHEVPKNLSKNVKRM